VDKKIKSIMGNNEKLSTSSAAILTALNLGDDMFKSRSLCKELSNKSESLEKQDKESILQLEDFKKQLNHMEAYNEELQNKFKNIENGEYVKTLEQENIRLQKELEVMKESTKICIEENRKIKVESKDIKFKLQSSKYKIIDLQNKLVEYQISIAKQRKISNPLLTKNKE